MKTSLEDYANDFAIQVETYVYQLKEGTRTSYYLQETKGSSSSLPKRMSITINQVAHVERKGRNLKPTTGQLLGNFIRDEQSPYKKCRPYSIRTQLWQVEGKPDILGYGTLGITDNGKIRDTGDVVTVHDMGGGDVVVAVARGSDGPAHFAEAIELCYNAVKEVWNDRA